QRYIAGGDGPARLNESTMTGAAEHEFPGDRERAGVAEVVDAEAGRAADRAADPQGWRGDDAAGLVHRSEPAVTDDQCAVERYLHRTGIQRVGRDGAGIDGDIDAGGGERGVGLE